MIGWLVSAEAAGAQISDDDINPAPAAAKAATARPHADLDPINARQDRAR